MTLFSTVLGSLAVSSLLLLSGPARADRIVGNGGDLVTCTAADGTKTHYVLDIYEALHMRGMVADFGSPPDPNDYMAMAKTVLERIEAVDPIRGATYLQWLASFEGEARILAHQTFDDIPDSSNVVLQTNCRQLDQLAVQRLPENPEDPRYLINGDLWDALAQEPEQRAALVVHEIIYRDAIARGHENSVATRYLVGLAAWDQFTSSIDSAQWQGRMRRKDFDAFVYFNPWPTTGHRKFLYFDEMTLTFDEATAFCRALSPNADLVAARDFTDFQDTNYNGWKASAIGRELLAKSPIAEVWQSAGPLSVVLFDQGTFSFATPTSNNVSVVCWNNN